ncbi:MAG: HD-GYP domain-containing protein [Deltaproteobacteria bacterium]
MSEIKISDILKKYKEERDKARSHRKEGDSKQKAETDQNSVRLASIMNKDTAQKKDVNIEELNGMYEQAVSKVKQLYKLQIDTNTDFASWINPPVEKIADYLLTGQKDLLKLCLCDYPKEQNYLYCHPVNVCILSLYIGLDYERSSLLELGTACLAHDIGIIKYLDLINKPGHLTKEEYVKVKEHSDRGFEILSKIGKGLSPFIFDAVRQEHERIDGSGYPKGLKDNQINEYGQIIGLVDVYEALTHSRPYRDKHTPLETIRIILDNKNTFSNSATKELIERVGIFPVGIAVQLNTKEIGVVLKENPKLPLRPVVEILVDAYGNELQTPKQIDLANNSVVYIEECLEDPRINRPNSSS